MLKYPPTSLVRRFWAQLGVSVSRRATESSWRPPWGEPRATGIFHEHLRRRSQRRGAPGLRYYEEFGAGVFREAGHHPLDREFLLEEKFLRLGSSFSSSRRALNRLSEQFLLWN